VLDLCTAGVLVVEDRYPSGAIVGSRRVTMQIACVSAASGQRSYYPTTHLQSCKVVPTSDLEHASTTIDQTKRSATLLESCKVDNKGKEQQQNQ
jgi:hypothetical protein